MAVDLNFENAFWLRIMNDHLQMIDERLAETEVELHQRVHQLRQEGAALLQDSQEPYEPTEFLFDVIALKEDILNREVNGTIRLAENPTTISDMLNEAHEYERILTVPEGGDPRRNPTGTVLDHHKLWLNDIVGHLDIIHNNLDGATYKDLKKRIHKMKKVFTILRDENIALIEYVINGVVPEQAALRLTGRAIQETQVYLDLLRQLYILRSNNRILGAITPELLDHMFREQSYYLVKIGGTPLGHQSLVQQALQGIA